VCPLSAPARSPKPSRPTPHGPPAPPEEPSATSPASRSSGVWATRQSTQLLLRCGAIQRSVLLTFKSE
jgi:hypothetical protein